MPQSSKPYWPAMQAPTIEALLANKDQLPAHIKARLAELLAERDRLAQIAAARTGFMDYTKYVWPNFIPGAHHAKMAAAFERVARGECKRLIINMAPRHALTTTTHIPTTAGMKTMASISPGDYVFGPDGVPTQVLGKSEVFKNRQLYRVWTDDGAYVDTDGEHLWTVRLDGTDTPGTTLTTQMLLERQDRGCAQPSLPVLERPLQCIVRGENIYADSASVVGVSRHIRVEKLSTTGSTQCIRVEREDGLFLAGDGYICTHNTKSEFASYLLPSWYLGLFPEKKVIQASNTGELAVGFGRKVRNLVDSDPYKDIFPGTELRADSKAAGRWATSKGGEYFAIGVGGTVTGKGADCAYFLSKIRTKRGILPLNYVRVGDYVYGYDHTQEKFVWTPVRAVSTQFKPELVNVGGVWLTPEHRVFSTRGYAPAAEVRDVAVRQVRERFSEGEEGSRARGSQAWSERQGVLFRGVLPPHQVAEGLFVRKPESPTCGWVQDMLPRWETCHPDMQHVQQGVQAAAVRAQEDGGSAWRQCARVLLKKLLRGVSNDTPGPLSRGHRVLQHLRKSYDQWAKVLFNGLLYNPEEARRPAALQQGLELAENGYEAPGSRDVRELREGEAAYGGSPHRPRRDQQQDEQFDPALRAVPQPLSSSVFGTCAADLAPLLHGEGFRVVDIQTGTGNFLADEVLVHNCLIIDDPHSEQEATLAESDPTIYDKAYEWYTSGPRQRLQPGGAIIIVMTRWSRKDLTGEVLKASAQRGGEEWDVIEFPAILPSGNPLWPEFWPLAELEALRQELPNHKWMAQYQQNPTSETAAIVKREWWSMWDEDKPPHCEFTLMSWDTAFEKHNRADYSACTLWGVFYRADASGVAQANIILLNAFRRRMEFPELKKSAIEQYTTWEPDSTIVEKKASGAPLIYELRAMGIPVQEFTPTRGNDKIARLNAVSDLFASGRVWAPRTHWAEEVMDEVASFPGGDNDDYVDSTSMALMRFRQGGFIRTLLDEDDNDEGLRTRALMNAQPYY